MTKVEGGNDEWPMTSDECPMAGGLRAGGAFEDKKCRAWVSTARLGREGKWRSDYFFRRWFTVSICVQEPSSFWKDDVKTR